MKYLITLMFLLPACIQKNSQRTHRHTHKLAKPLSLSFKSKDRVLVKIGHSSISNANLQIFHQIGDSKTLLFDGAVTESKNLIDFTLDNSFESEGGVLAAVVQATDQNDQAISSVATYKLGEQEEIDAVKKRMLKN